MTTFPFCKIKPSHADRFLQVLLQLQRFVDRIRTSRYVVDVDLIPDRVVDVRRKKMFNFLGVKTKNE